ncbi:MAG: hypothetical protein MZV65_40595 [Chromatiales bacterium]|nr:hypothetical protein [Chromatiales bacterium]
MTYEFQPLGERQPGPIRTLTRVKGLAFGRTQYAANIQRDYDQRVGVSVRNNGETKLRVRPRAAGRAIRTRWRASSALAPRTSPLPWLRVRSASSSSPSAPRT